MSNLYQHARAELEYAGYSADTDDELDYEIYEKTLQIVHLFSQCGHSGYSAEAHRQMIHQLLGWQPLGPITNSFTEWMQVDTNLWQNRRDSRMFSHDKGLTYYNVDELRRGWRSRLFGRVSKWYTAVEGAK